MRVGLVLGAGGVVGASYHAGALAALEHDIGWDPRTADVVVGTSAGSLIGALLRNGVPASDLAAWTVGAALSPIGALVTRRAQRPTFDPVTLRQFVRLPRRPHPRAVIAALRAPHRFDPLRALLTHLPDGARPILPHVEFLGTRWPERDLRLCAVRRSDGRRVVFGRDLVPSAGVSAAVAASCAVPGYFAPVEVDGTHYIDGGLKSPTNADVLRDGTLDVIVVLAPMAAAVPVPRAGVDGVVRRRSGAQLERELDAARRRGTKIAVFAPGREVLQLTTTDFMSDEHSQAVVAAAFLETGEQARAPERARVLEALGARRSVTA